MKRGLFITFEGLEGAGKSVGVGYLASRLRENGYRDIVVTREPGGTRVGEQIRAITHNPENVDLSAVAEAYLMAASRAQHLREIIKPALDDGKIVISDRFLDSSITYQGYGRELGADIIQSLNKLAVGGVVPDLTLVLEIPIDVGIARRNGTTKIDRMDLQQREFYERVARGYKQIMKSEPKRFAAIDATKTIEEVGGLVWQRVYALLENSS